MDCNISQDLIRKMHTSIMTIVCAETEEETKLAMEHLEGCIDCQRWFVQEMCENFIRSCLNEEKLCMKCEEAHLKIHKKLKTACGPLFIQ